jgi:2-oxoglutarate ferredoxin oxidoreductase subunit alpha
MKTRQPRELDECVNIILAGEAGQGIQSIEALLTRILKEEGYHLFSTKEYMSRIRGGVNSTQIRVAARRVAAYSRRSDLVILLNQESAVHLQDRISADTVVLGEKEKVSYPGLVDAPFSTIANAAGNSLFANTVAVGLICGLFHVDPGRIEGVLRRQYAGKAAEIQEGNVKAVRRGYALAAELLQDKLRLNIPRDGTHAEDLVFSGSEAIAMGALAGGCDYLCAYPMSPSTGVLTAMADYSRAFDVIVEQVEDEIGVVNMALGAWYAGARALVTTSGGGFALMMEGFSLAGMIESPLVVHLSQRPGPATGLPTRTEQADLNLALHAGHGEFPRVILAPGTLAQGFRLAQRAFALADKYQVPVVLLTDQYYVDSYYNTPLPDMRPLDPSKHVARTVAGYRRYELKAGPLSPRGIPGYGDGFVKADSDEHDEDGHITEDLGLRARMVRKRLAKADWLRQEAEMPGSSFAPGAETVVISWGSTFHAVEEALAGSGRHDIGHLHFSQLYPLPAGVKAILAKAKKRIVIEGNAGGQFARLLERETGATIDVEVHKYDGMPFAVEEIQFVLKEAGDGGDHGKQIISL